MVYGVEIVDRAVKDAAENARINGIDNARFITGKAEEILPEFYSEGGEKLLQSFSGAGNENNTESTGSVAEEAKTPDVIVVDPPRKGLDTACIDTMTAMSPEKIVYVSCNPSTLARDLRLLTDGGYKLMKFTPVDQFSRTVHVECVTLMSRAKE
jgi:23S rRNA (uracil1939-C5)-methyltransferase